MSSAFRVREGRGDGRNGGESSGLCRSGGRRSSGRNRVKERWSVVGFEDNALMAWNRAPFIEYNVTRLKKFVCGLVHKAKGTALLGKSKKRARH
jgi:hypothetical protein